MFKMKTLLKEKVNRIKSVTDNEGMICIASSRIFTCIILFMSH